MCIFILCRSNRLIIQFLNILHLLFLIQAYRLPNFLLNFLNRFFCGLFVYDAVNLGFKLFYLLFKFCRLFIRYCWHDFPSLRSSFLILLLIFLHLDLFYYRSESLRVNIIRTRFLLQIINYFLLLSKLNCGRIFKHLICFIPIKLKFFNLSYRRRRMATYFRMIGWELLESF